MVAPESGMAEYLFDKHTLGLSDEAKLTSPKPYDFTGHWGSAYMLGCLYLFCKLHQNILLSSLICTISSNKEFWYLPHPPGRPPPPPHKKNKQKKFF